MYVCEYVYLSVLFMRAHVSLCICVFLKTSVSFPEKRDDFHCNYMNSKACTLCQAVGFHKCLMKEIKKDNFLI